MIGTTVFQSITFRLSTLVAALASAINPAQGAGMLGYSPTTAYTQGVGKRLNDDLTTTGFPTLQAAVTAAAGKTLHVLGAWPITAAVVVPSNTTVVVEAGASITTVTPDIHMLDASGQSNVYLHVRGKIASTATTGTLSHIGIVNFTNAIDCTVFGAELIGFQWAAVLMTGATNCWALHTRSHDFLSSVQDCAAVQVTGAAVGCGILGGYAKNSGYHGVNVQETGDGLVPQGTLIQSYKISSTKVYGLNFYNKTAHTVDQNSTARDVDITDVMGGAPFNTSGGAPIYIQSAGNVKVFGGTLSYSCWGTSDNSLTAAGIGISLTDICTPATIDGVTFVNMGFKPNGTQNPNAITIAAISVNSGLTGANIGPCTVRQTLANTAGAFTFIGYYVNANSSVSMTAAVMDINPAAVNSRGIFLFANQANMSNIVINGARITGCDLAHIAIDQSPAAGPVICHVSFVNMSNLVLGGGSANCANFAINQAAVVNGSNITANATTAPSLSLSASTFCTFATSRTVSTGVTSIVTSGVCTGTTIEETVSFGPDSKMLNAGTGSIVKTAGTAIPVAGTWGVGDRRANSPTAAAQPTSWKCRGLGAPGIWGQEGTIT